MEDEQKTIIVPWDFTPVAFFAAEHAANFASITGSKVYLLHIVKKSSETGQAMEKLKKACSEIQVKTGLRADPLVKEGSIFTTIGEIATEYNSELVVMGTHGIKGMQKIMGSWALKVIASSKVPFVVVQDSPKRMRYDKVLFPVNFKREEKEKIKWALYLAKLYRSKIYVLKPGFQDAAFKRGVHSNLVFAEKYFKNQKLDFEVHESPGIDFVKETIEYAEKLDTDLILIMTTKDINFTDYVLGAAEQSIIANSSKLPIMCVNPRPSRYTSGFSASGG